MPGLTPAVVRSESKAPDLVESLLTTVESVSTAMTCAASCGGRESVEEDLTVSGCPTRPRGASRGADLDYRGVASRSSPPSWPSVREEAGRVRRHRRRAAAAGRERRQESSRTTRPHRQSAHRRRPTPTPPSRRPRRRNAVLRQRLPRGREVRLGGGDDAALALT